MNIFNYFKEVIEKELQELSNDGSLPEELSLGGVTVEPPRDASHGDIATNAALVLSKQAKMNPRAVAELLAPKLEANSDVASVDIAGPGFINLRLDPSFWQKQIITVLTEGTSFGSSDLGAGEPVNVEYVSANPTGPLHLGHVRGAVFGDALSNLMQKAGYEVSKEYLINDAGSQIDTLAESSYLRYREALGEDIGEIPEGLYPGDYLLPVGAGLNAKYGDSLKSMDKAEWMPLVRDFATNAMMDLVRSDLKALGIEHDVFFSEKTLHDSGRIGEAIEDLRSRGHIYEGVLEPPKGKKPDDWEAREQTLFRATAFGDDVDRALQKSNGDYTYFGADIAYHFDKYQRGFKSMINVWGADHGGYIKRMQSAVKALADDASLDVKICQLVRLFRDGEPVKMSKRAGTFITMKEVVDEVGPDVTRFIMLTRKNDAPLDFDFKKATEQSKDNPVFYVQYAHARICSVLRNRAQQAFEGLDTSDEALKDADLSVLDDVSELALMRQMSAFPRMIESASEAHEPHRIAFYLYDLASEFHSLWNKGNDNPNLRFVIEDDKAATLARLALIRSVGLVIASGLAILGVKPVEEMR